MNEKAFLVVSTLVTGLATKLILGAAFHSDPLTNAPLSASIGGALWLLFVSKKRLALYPWWSGASIPIIIAVSVAIARLYTPLRSCLLPR